MCKMKYQYHNPKVVSYEEEETIKNLLLYHKIQEILDFSIGDTVYQNKHNYCTPLTVKRIIIEENDIIYETDTQKFTKADIGKTIFYTFDDAKTYDLLFSKQDMIGKRYQNPKGIANGHICEVTANPDNWGTCQVIDLETRREFLCSKRFILEHEIQGTYEKSFTGHYDNTGKPIFVGDTVYEGCNGLVAKVEFNQERGAYWLAGLGDGYGIEDSNIEWKILDPEEVKEKELPYFMDKEMEKE